MFLLGLDEKMPCFVMKKKINLEGPGCFHHFSYDLWQDKPFFSKLLFWGGSVMVWAGFAANGMIPIVSIRSRLNSEWYADMLTEKELPEAQIVRGGGYLF